MPVTKRTTKIVSYNEQDDDDDFVSIGDSTKKNRNAKSNDSSKESKSLKTNPKQLPRKNDEKLIKLENEESELLLKKPKETTIENSITIDDKENKNNQLNDENRISSEKVINIDEQDEDLLPKSKRIKYEEEDNINEKECGNENEQESSCETEEAIKKIDISTTSSIDLNISQINQQNSSIQISDLSKKRSSLPIGFPTSKINIASSHVPRVGLSRKSSTIKPLHPNFTSRIIHE